MNIDEFPTLELGIEQIVDEENYVLYTVRSIVSIKKNEEKLPIMKVDWGKKEKLIRLPTELWSWGNELAKRNFGNYVYVKFSYNEENDLWCADIVDTDYIVTHCSGCYYYPISFKCLKEDIAKKWKKPYFCEKCEQKTTEEKIEVLKGNLEECWYRKEETEQHIKILEKIQQHEKR